MMSRLLAAAALAAFVVAGLAERPLAARGQEGMTRVAQAQPESQDEFVPIDELPPEDRLPAAPLLVGAYAFVLAVLFAYVTLVARRLTGLQRDIARLETQIGSDGKG